MKTSTPINRRRFLQTCALAGNAAAFMPLGLLPRLARRRDGELPPRRRIPVILATDIGDDIDDTWALGFLLKCPELDLKLVLTEYGKPQYRGKLAAKFLQATGHAHVVVGLGPEAEPRGEGGQAGWVKDYNLAGYPGKVHPDGVQALIDTIMHSRRTVTLICIGPMPNVAAALVREPRIAQHARFVGMDGSVRLGYGGASTAAAEWNVKASVAAAQKGLAAPWPITITPLDTCGLVTLDGERYRRMVQSIDPVARAILDNYRLWSQGGNNRNDAEQRSSVLFDTVAVYLAFSQAFCQMETLGIRVTDDGFTRIDGHAKRMQVATAWKSLNGYRDFLVQRLTGAA